MGNTLGGITTSLSTDIESVGAGAQLCSCELNGISCTYPWYT